VVVYGCLVWRCLVISEADRRTIVELAFRYGVSRLLLFGSSASPDREARDIDLAVEGLPASRYFKFYGELMFALSKPVDLVDLSEPSRFTHMIQQEGVLLYG
jgi:uncharacterized protein